MNNQHQTKALLSQFLAQGEDSILIDLLINQIKNDSSHYDTIVLISSKYHSVQKKYAESLLSSEEYNVEMQKIRNSLQYFIQELPSDIAINTNIEKKAKRQLYFSIISISVLALGLILGAIWMGLKKSEDIDIELQIKSSSISFEPSTNKGLLEEDAQIKADKVHIGDIQWIDSIGCEIEPESKKDKLIWAGIYDKNGFLSIDQTVIKQIGINTTTTILMEDKNAIISNKNRQGEEIRLLIDSTSKISMDQSSAEETIGASVKNLCELNIRYKSVIIGIKDSVKINQYAIPVKSIAFQRTEASQSKSSIIGGRIIIGNTADKFDEILLEPNKWLTINSSNIKKMTIKELVINNKGYLSVILNGKVTGLMFASKDLMPSRIEWLWHYHKYWLLLSLLVAGLFSYLFLKYRNR